MTHDLTYYWHRFVRGLFAIAIVTGLTVACGAVSAAPKLGTDQIIVKAKPGREVAAMRAHGKGRLKKKIRH